MGQRVPQAVLSRIQVLVTLARLERDAGREVPQATLTQSLSSIEGGAGARSRQTVAWWATRLAEDGMIERLTVQGRPCWRLTPRGWEMLAAALAPAREQKSAAGVAA